MSDYDVGYAKPPKSHQFEKGRSGNPSGRPKKSKNLKNILLSTMEEEIVIKEGNQTRVITKAEALVKATVNKALGGDTRAMKWVSEKLMEIQVDDTGDRPLSDDDAKILKMFLESQ